MKVLFVATVVKKHIMEFHIPYLKMFHDMGWETAVAARNDYEKAEDCKIPYCDIYYDLYFERSPLKIGNLRVYKQIKGIIESENYDIIHCHTPMGAAVTRLAARDARKAGTRVIYTAHGFHFYKDAPVKNWIFYYPVEKYLSKYTDTLITINEEDYQLAKKKFYTREVAYIPGVGIDLRKFRNQIENTSELRKSLRISDSDFVLLSVGEIIARKNHVQVINAIDELVNRQKIYDVKYLICGTGQLMDFLEKLVKQKGLQDYISFLGYRSDIPEVCNMSDVFVFMSLQEGLPVALMEAMACGKACIATKIRGNRDLIDHNINGLLIDNDTSSLVKMILNLKNDKVMVKKLGNSAREKIKLFDLKIIEQQMHRIYFMDK